jgi:type I restriction enzyme M protein
MSDKTNVKILGFEPKEHASDMYIKKYADNYAIEIDFAKNTLYFGGKICIGDKTTHKITKPEDWVVLECVNRLLEKGYKPENIQLEKVYPAGHGFSARLDICVTRDDGSEYLLIECKTYGKEFDKAFTRMKKEGGQLFTYFKFSNKPDVIMLYASQIASEIVYRNEIVKIEEDYRSGDVKDFYEKWNKLTKDNGVFDSWVHPYDFESKALTINELEEIRQEDSSFIFNRFLEILRHNVVSDKGNAFNRIFTLFLCKIYDEKINEGTDNELGFQWLDGVDDHRSFQIRLTDLYKNGMHEFLEKAVTDFSETEFNNKFTFLTDEQRNPILEEFRRIRLEKNNEFAIKDVYDEQSFNENAVVVKEIVELLQGYKLRYTKKQQYLSDFFELLLTTGLKQESGQFFTPVPVAQFVIKSLPIDTLLEEKLSSAKIDNDTLLPYVMDYAAGSGHFLTETMHEMQRLLNTKDDKKYPPSVAKKIRNWQDDHFAWAIQYVYGIEKDYRLVKVGKVGCYLHGDGLANVIHSDGLARFNHPDYKGKLLLRDKNFPQDNKQFDIIVSNPPYSVSAFKNTARAFYKNGDFELYDKLTDNSSEIECLFIERTKQLLKDGGVAGVILPSSILSNTGIYSKSREIILQYFDIVGITELGSNTFMATGTNTVVLFLRRRNNYEHINLKIAVEKFFTTHQDVTLNGIEKPVSKYLNHVWEGLALEDYLSLVKREPSKVVAEHELYKEYQKKLKAKNDKEFWNPLQEREAQKLLYFIIAYPQKVVLVKSGEKDAEKRFLGYEFSNRRGSEGIHPIQRGKNIEECTQLFDAEVFDNPTKASTYIYKAFLGDFDSPIDECLQKNISRHNLIDMMTFDRVEFEKNISLSVKKKVKIESKWVLKKLGEISLIDYGTRIVKKTEQGTIYPVYGGGGETFKSDNYNRENVFIISRFGMSPRCVRYVSGKFFLNDSGLTLNTADSSILNQSYLNQFLFLHQEMVYICGQGVAQKNLEIETFKSVKIPLPPLDIQQKIVDEIEVLEANEKSAKEEVEGLNQEKNIIIDNLFSKNKYTEISNIVRVLGGKRIPKGLSFSPTKTDYPYIRVTDFKNGTVDLNSLKYIDEEVFNQIKNYIITKEDIYISIAGTIGLVGLIPETLDGKSLTENAAKIVITEKKSVSKEFLYYCLISENLQKQIEDNTRAVGVPKLALKRIETLKIPLPPLDEQQKIVSQIEKIEAQIALLEAQIGAIPKQKEAILKKYL